MHSTLASLLGLLAVYTVPTVAQHGAYFIVGAGMPVAIVREDPLLAPGKASSHVHSVVGGNAFAETMDFDTTQSSTCSTIKVKQDKSNYWMPALYFHAKNGSFIRVPEKPDHRIYYKFGNNDASPDKTRSEFPPGFRMISGDANLRSDDGSFGTGGNQLNWVCHDGGNNPKAVGFPKGFTQCDGYGFAASMRFPSCWNGNDFDAKNPLAHMDFPTNQDGLAGCRAPFNVKRFPEIFLEYYLNTASFNGLYGPNDSPFVLAQGDPTGYGFHMDFINGWEVGALQNAMKACNIGNTGDPLDSPQCFGAGSLRSSDEADSCRATDQVGEDVGLVDKLATDNSHTRGGVLAALPGCNPIQAGPQKATPQTCGGSAPAPAAPVKPAASSSPLPVKPATSSTPVVQTKAASVPPAGTTLHSTSSTKIATAAASPSKAPSAGGTATGVTIPSGWVYSGCYTDNLNPRSLGKQPEWWGQQITSTNCIAHCKSIGYSIAGTENEGQCFCGNDLKQSQPAPGKCNSPCVGNKGEICGGPGVLSIFKASGKSKHKYMHRSAHRVGVIS